MKQVMQRLLKTLLVLPLATSVLSGTAFANDQRNCKTEFAVFPTGSTEDATFRLTIAVSAKTAKVRVAKSGEWSGRRERHASGADTIVFETNAAVETLTIGATGNFLWEIDYKDPSAHSDRVIGFIGFCEPWRPQ